MVKKTLLITLLVGLIGVLTAGAIIRTLDKTENVAEARGAGYGRGGSEAAGYPAAELGQGLDPSGETRGRGGYGRGGYGGEGRVDAPGDGTGSGAAEVDEWLRIDGTVVSVDGDALVVLAEDGTEIVVENRAWWFAQDQGFSLQVGDEVTLVGFYEGDDFEVGQILDITHETGVEIREESGRPQWAGGGRRGG